MNTSSLSTALGSDDPSSNKPDILVPLDPDGNRIIWPSGSNPAYLPGIRFEADPPVLLTAPDAGAVAVSNVASTATEGTIG